MAKEILVQFLPVYTRSMRLVPFSFTATEGQTEFIFEVVPKGVLMVVINGAMQNQQGGDFDINDDTLTLDSPVSEGDKVYGVYYE